MIPPNDYMEVEVAHEEDDQELMEIEEDFSDDSSNDSGMDNEVIKLVRHGLLYPDDVYDLHITDVMCMLEFYYIDEEDESLRRYCSSCVIRGNNQFSYLRLLRRHTATEEFILHDGYSCWGCECPLFQIMPCNMCPICTE